MEKKIDLFDYSDESIEFILSESQNAISDTISAYRENTNKSYAALGVYSAIASYFFSILLDNSASSNSVFLISHIACVSVSIIIMLKNLKPKEIVIKGAMMDMICHPYYTEDIELNMQERAIKVSRIEDLNEAIKSNSLIIQSQISTFRRALSWFLFSSAVIFILFCLFG